MMVSIGQETVEAANQLAPASGTAGESASKVFNLVTNQEAGRWGVEEGPDAFRLRYREVLWEKWEQINLLKTRLDTYVDSVIAAATDFEGQDEAAAERINAGKAETEAATQVQQSTMESLETVVDATQETIDKIEGER